ncbi:MAG: hypothetical protein ACTSP4_05880 [Candidatus Hodarchaeales archaeon]
MIITENLPSRIVIEERGSKILAILLLTASIGGLVISFWMYDYFNISKYDIILIVDFSSLELMIFYLVIFFSTGSLFTAYREFRYFTKMIFDGNDSELTILERGIITKSSKIITKRKIQSFSVVHSSRMSFPYFYSSRENLWIIRLISTSGTKYIVYAELGLLAKDNIERLYGKMCDLIGWEAEDPEKENGEITCSKCGGKFPLRVNFCPFCGKNNSAKSRRIRLDN